MTPYDTVTDAVPGRAPDRDPDDRDRLAGRAQRAGAPLVLSLLYQLEQSQWWPAEAMAQPPARDSWPRSSSTPPPPCPSTAPACGRRAGPRASRLTAEQWRRLPVLRRPELQEAGDDVVSDAVPADHGRQFTLMTSGSTGRPVQTVGTGLTQLFWSTLTVRDHLWHRRDFSRKLAVIRQFPLAQAPAGGRFDPPPTGARPPTACSAPGPPSPSTSTARCGSRRPGWPVSRPGYLLTYPSNVVALARHFSERGERPARPARGAHVRRDPGAPGPGRLPGGMGRPPGRHVLQPGGGLHRPPVSRSTTTTTCSRRTCWWRSSTTTASRAGRARWDGWW